MVPHQKRRPQEGHMTRCPRTYACDLEHGDKEIASDVQRAKRWRLLDDATLRSQLETFRDRV